MVVWLTFRREAQRGSPWIAPVTGRVSLALRRGAFVGAAFVGGDFFADLFASR
jgi:hypothetical protein